MQRKEALELLRQCKPELIRQFGVVRLALFGSTARNTATATSDVDILVTFDGVANARQFFGVQFYLEDHVGSPIDLVTEKALRDEFRPYVEQDLVDV